MGKVISPLTNSSNTTLCDIIPTAEIGKRYFENFEMDVSHFFKGVQNIEIHECLDTGFKFYQPFGVDGDGPFYEKLQQFPWYYMPWKWEHEQVLKQIKTTDRVLEIGCGPAYFIQKLKELGINCTGLELNSKTVEDAVELGLDVRQEMVQEHAANVGEQYDVVCSFQVMEHIASIREVLDASVKCLKKGGRLFISVPNNDSFLGLDKWNVLNMPPHHMGLWNRKSLASLTSIFPLKLGHIYLESLQKQHEKYYAEVVKNHIYQSFLQRYGSFVGKVMNKIFHDRSLKQLKKSKTGLESFTIIAEFTKL